MFTITLRVALLAIFVYIYFDYKIYRRHLQESREMFVKLEEEISDYKDEVRMAEKLNALVLQTRKIIENVYILNLDEQEKLKITISVLKSIPTINDFLQTTIRKTMNLKNLTQIEDFSPVSKQEVMEIINALENLWDFLSEEKKSIIEALLKEEISSAHKTK